ncbi:cytochrome P450 (plasmid) [Sphingomonas paeninsulae]|uniref:Cytochrome P450 n=1 Tax=Sphingomonas paeninsulae TaxID=2319844 RepID=A0A494TJJ6_SPHPE|nr:cytochrome P450 [Sphingomonas paeninsulae]AYJ85305.1 cytochrome P450 [Sphingomonas paeninsulae]
MKSMSIPKHIPAERVFAFDLVDDVEAGGLHDAHVALHGRAPDVFYTPLNGGHWMVTRMVDAQKVMTDLDNYSSMDVLPQMPWPLPRLNLPPQDMDAPDHLRYRLLLLRFLAPKEVNKLEPGIRCLMSELIDAVLAKGGTEFVADIAVPLPVKTFMGMMHMDLTRYAEFVRWANGILASRTTRQRLLPFIRMNAYLRSLIRIRKRAPSDDPVSMLLAAEVNGEKLTDKRVLEVCNLLFLAGLDTVTNALTFITRHLAENPADQQRLRENPDQIPGAIEEFLRRYAFVTVMRRVKHDTELNGALLRAGDKVIVSLPAACNDERAFGCPMHVDLDRPRPGHIAFNTGPHNCAGAPMARIELRVFLEEWLARVPPFHLVEAQKCEMRGGNIMAMETLRLAW